jgi:small subunit ribosomal protein S4
MYGVMEDQFRQYMAEAFNNPGITGLHLLRTLERRLDNVIYRLGFADSRKQGRQMVNHGHFLVNGARADIPSYLVEAGDAIAWKESVKRTDFFKERTEGLPKRPVPPWLSLNQNDMTGQVISLPADEDLQQDINSRLIVEYYSR